jgi:ferricrocin synthase
MFDEYNPPSLQLSTRRKPSEGSHTSSIRLHNTPSHDNALRTISAAIAVCLGQWTSVQDVLLGQLVTGGYLPIRCRWSPSDSWNRLVENVQIGEEADSKQSVATKLHIEHGRDPFTASFHLLDDNPSHESSNDTPIAFQLSQNGDKLTLRASLKLLSPEFCELCLQIIDNILSTLHTRGSDPIENGYLSSESSLLSIDTREPGLLPPYQHVMSWVDDRAREQPDVPAVIYYESVDSECQEERMSYSELSSRSSQMAHYLVNHGASSGDKIAVCMRRNLGFHVSLSAILKAGTCYVPVSQFKFETRNVKFKYNRSTPIYQTRGGSSYLMTVMQNLCW